jgi:hypothetical protein
VGAGTRLPDSLVQITFYALSTADGRVAISLPIERAAAIRAEMKSNPITAVGVALVNLPLTVEPDPLFRITRTEMETGAGAALARLAVAQINSIRFTRGNHSKRAAVALPDLFHRFSSDLGVHSASFADLLASSRAGRGSPKAIKPRSENVAGSQTGQAVPFDHGLAMVTGKAVPSRL